MSEVQSPKSKVEEKTLPEDTAEIEDLSIIDGELLEDSTAGNRKPEAGSQKPETRSQTPSF